MTQLGRASTLVGVVAGGYAILMLINGQLKDFYISAGVCAVALLGTGRPPASHFETLAHLMLRRSPSARRGVMSRSQYIDAKEEKYRERAQRERGSEDF